ncbi:MAG: hypothetical protein CM15mP23_03440 [Cryomorphaceae bacterium]|nr:MAG: hypothetical protein CM15mP23_03440 [Cryomorphaceae bacterium]
MLGLNNLPTINMENSCSNIPEYIAGCTDDNAINYNSDANIDDGSCEYSNINPVSGIVFSGVFGGTYADANTYTNPSGSESWAGFANEDASVYPFTFGDGGSISFNGLQMVLQQIFTSDLNIIHTLIPIQLQYNIFNFRT